MLQFVQTLQDLEMFVQKVSAPPKPQPLRGRYAAVARRLRDRARNSPEENREKFTPKRPKTPTWRPAQWLRPAQLPSETSLSNAAAHSEPLPPFWARFLAVLGPFWRISPPELRGDCCRAPSKLAVAAATQPLRGRYPAVTRPLRRWVGR